MDYDVQAKLIFDAANAKTVARQMRGEVTHLDTAVRRTNFSLTQTVTKLVAFGSAYLGIRTLTGLTQRLTGSAIKYTSELEATKIGLTSVIQAVDQLDWGTATKGAEQAFERIKELSLASPAGPQEMFEIFNMILGPLRGAGKSMEFVYDMTNDATLAAAALGVDYQQAARDIGLIATGAAGADVKLFRLLRSTKAITESTEEWNKKLTEQQRAEKLSAALKKFAGSGEAFGRSWKGLTSTFAGIKDEFAREGMTPVMNAVGNTLGRVNDAMLRNKRELTAGMQSMGIGVARIWNSTVDRINWDTAAHKLASGADTVGRHAASLASTIDRVVDRWDAIALRFKQGASIAAAMGAEYLLFHKLLGGKGEGASTAAAAASGGKGGGSWKGRAMDLGIAGGVAASGGPVGGAMAALHGSDMLMRAGNVSTLNKAMLAAMPGIGVFGQYSLAKDALGRGGPEGGGGGGGGGGMGQLGGVLGMAGTAGAALLAVEHFDRLNAAVTQTGSITERLAGATHEAAVMGEAQAKVMGMIPLAMTTAKLNLFHPAMRMVGSAVERVLIPMKEQANVLYYELSPAFDFVIGKIGQMGTFLNGLADDFDKFMGIVRMKAPELSEFGQRERADVMHWGPIIEANGGGSKTKTPDVRQPKPTVNVDARGAKVTIKQEFGDTDPDRVLSLMYHDLGRQAESRISSVLAPALTR